MNIFFQFLETNDLSFHPKYIDTNYWSHLVQQLAESVFVS